MSNWRYEVDETLCDSTSEYRPRYVVYSEKSIRESLGKIYSGSELEDNIEYWNHNYSEIPTVAIYHELDWCVKGYTYGKRKIGTFFSISDMYEAKRIGRMFPRHKQQIVYK